MRYAADRSEENVGFDLAEVVRESLVFLKPRLKAVTVDMDIPAPLPVKGSKGMLEQLVLNLLLIVLVLGGYSLFLVMTFSKKTD